MSDRSLEFRLHVECPTLGRLEAELRTSGLRQEVSN
jgi:hypothetical protein